MDKNAIKKYAVWARKELISRVAQKAQQYGITETEMVDAGADSVNGKVLSAEEMQQRRALIAQINEKGYQQVMEEVAYTWFNRFSALRFMEVNGYLPSHVRVFTDENNAFKPQILAEALHLELDKLDKDKVYALKETEQTEELYKYLLIVQCNALNSILPGMFQTIADYTELLLPDNLLREGSVIEQMISQIPEDNWQDAVQIIGWLYQYYNSEKKDDVFAALKKNVKITKENIPAATQLFTPDWIVRYMVENSLGRLWVEGHPDAKAQLLPTPEEQAAYTAGNRDPEDTKWHYYLEEAQQELQVQAQLSEISKQYADLTPEQIKVIDPCCGSGHILAYLFDVLMQIYENYGYTPRDAVASILQNNLYGLDIDDRAAQLAYFAVMMKAVRYDKRFLKRKDEDGEPDVPQPHVYAIEESNRIEKPDVEYFCNGKLELNDAMHTILTQLYDAKEYGSILTITPQDWDALYARFDEVTGESSFHRESIRKKLLPLVRVAQTLAQKYDVVVTNPPYMGSSGMGAKLAEYVKKNYPDSKSDLFAVFIEVCSRMAKQNGYQAMITQHAWMFLSSFEKLREKMMLTETISMAHLGARAFEEIGGEVVQTTAFVRCANHVEGYKGTYCRLIEPTSQQGKEEMFLAGQKRYTANQDDFAKIPGASVAYWVSKKLYSTFRNSLLYDYTISDGQNKTGDNAKFVREFWEVRNSNVGKGKKWLFYAKGGGYRKWYGNLSEVVNWSEEAREFYKNDKICRIIPEYLWYKAGITWSLISNNPSFRLLPEEATFDVGGSSIFLKDNSNIEFVLGLLNSKVFSYVQKIVNPTINIQVKDIRVMLVMPEACTPKEWLPTLARTCEKNHLAVVTGVEHIIEDNCVYNLTAVILPYEEKWTGQWHSVILYHSKNHFAPEEKRMIESLHLRAMEGIESSEAKCDAKYELYSWNGFWFTVYCCFELTSIRDRSIFQSYIDAVIAVEWNHDVNYYSNIIESLSRDIHCYCIQTNTSEYGDSRITKPSKTENKDILRIKGGSNATAHVGTIDLEQLREFQMKAYSGQKEDKTFKPTPPDFDYKGAYERRKGTMFECFCAKKKAD